MANSIKNSINLSLFAVLKVSERSKVPVMIVSNPGIGKSTTVELFAKVRGYKLLLLRGNTNTAEQIMGYDTAGPKAEEQKAAIHLRPSWFKTILDNEKRGEKTLLFLDEITTTNPDIQAALLHLIFERKVEDEDIPESTLIVAAGNYAQNLSDSMEMLPPTLNRFLIYNLEFKVSDLSVFLNKYKGASIGKVENYFETLRKDMEALDKQESESSRRNISKIGELIESCICDTAKYLMDVEKTVDLNVKDIKNIYTESVETGGKLYGFITPRTLGYLVSVAIETFICFGKSGITGSTFRNMIDGLCGVGFSRDPKTGDTKINKVGDEFYKNLITTVDDIEKMRNDKLPYYVDFFNEIIDKGNKEGGLDVSLLQATINKVDELSRDVDLSNISRPIDPVILTNLYSLVRTTTTKLLAGVSIQKEVKISDVVSVEKATSIAVTWNLIADLLMSIGGIVLNKKYDYKDTAIKQFEAQPDRLKSYRMNTIYLRNYYVMNDKSLGSIIPDVKAIVVKKS